MSDMDLFAERKYINGQKLLGEKKWCSLYLLSSKSKVIIAIANVRSINGT